MPIVDMPPANGGDPETLKRHKGKSLQQNIEGLHSNEDMGPSPVTPPSGAAASQLAPQDDLHTPRDADPTALSNPQPQANRATGISASPSTGTITVDGVEFHHASEGEFARLLTYYGIEWQYEPNQFPLQWHEGRPVEMFSPDFYLTEYDLYIELTTMRQSLVRRKNRKLRLLRALYPEINIKLLYRRDYQRLLERFGIRSEEVEMELPPSAEESE